MFDYNLQAIPLNSTVALYLVVHPPSTAAVSMYEHRGLGAWYFFVSSWFRSGIIVHHCIEVCTATCSRATRSWPGIICVARRVSHLLHPHLFFVLCLCCAAFVCIRVERVCWCMCRHMELTGDRSLFGRAAGKIDDSKLTTDRTPNSSLLSKNNQLPGNHDYANNC